MNKKLAFFLLFIFFTSGCTVIEVKPWERGILAKPEMAGDPDGIESGVRDHTYHSKEGSSGGASAGGGGCGCN